ncbi:hypothetical protein Sjap_007572 [Stephania japonica]|uniref:Uncharacterized protein n=1 Tax=Stephania japonica TaxID=461633 RepID=A0AAP0JMX4_9MAGN
MAGVRAAWKERPAAAYEGRHRKHERPGSRRSYIIVNEAQSRGNGGGGGRGGGFRSGSGAASRKTRDVLLHYGHGYPPPLRSHFPLRRPAREAATLWPATGGPSDALKRRRGAVVGVGEGSTSSPPRLSMGEDDFPPTRLTGQGSVDPGPVDQWPNWPLDSTRDQSGPAL